MAWENGDAHRDYWLARAASVRRQVNLGWWLETLAAPLVLVSLVGAAVLLWTRREFPMLPPWIPIASVCGVVILLATACLVRAMARFERAEDSLVRIEAAMRMRNALSAAAAGVAPWPAPMAGIHAGVSWQWPRIMIPVLGALILLLAGMWIPVTARQSAVPASPEEPQAWKQLATELDHLTKEEVVDEPYLEETRKRLDELKAQEEEQWFSHSSLEATDSLKKAHRAETGRIEQEIAKAEKALNALEKAGGSISEAEKNRLMEEFDQALQGLQNGAMKPNPELLEQMKGMDLKNLADLAPEQLQQLRDNLRKHAKGMKGEGDEFDFLAEGEGEEGEGEGEQPGAGGVDRGPGHAPGVLGAVKDPLGTGAMTALEATDLTRSAPGDLLELQDGEHDVDRSGPTNTAGGNTEATGRGGDRVWRDALDPDEQRVLKRYFE